MTRHLSVALFTEGGSDEAFLSRVLNRQILKLAAEYGTFGFEAVIPESCRSIAEPDRLASEVGHALKAYNIVLVHNDDRERRKIGALVGRVEPVPYQRSLLGLIPVRETEAWALADPAAFASVRGADAARVPTAPKAVERIEDPKAELRTILGCRATDDVFEILGDGVDLDRLALVPAYQKFLNELTNALKELHFL